MPDRFSPARPRMVEVALLTMLVLVIFLSGVVVYAIITGDPDQETRIEQKVDEQLTIIKGVLDKSRKMSAASSCTNYQNQRAIEEAVRDHARARGIVVGDPHVRPSAATLAACRLSGVPIVDGQPALGVLPGD